MTQSESNLASPALQQQGSIHDRVNSSSARPPIHVILADSQAIYRVGMSKIFAAEGDLHIAAQVDKLEDLHSLPDSLSADVLVLEGNLLAGTTDAIPAIVTRLPDIKIIVQTASS